MKVLIAIDEFDFVEDILDFAINHEWPAEIEFRIISVIESPNAGNFLSLLPKPVLDEVLEDQRKLAAAVARKVTIALRETFRAGEITDETDAGDPKAVILKAAKEWHADLIIMGCHGRRGLDRLMVGSVSQAVASEAPCTVVVLQKPKKSNQENVPVEKMVSC